MIDDTNGTLDLVGHLDGVFDGFLEVKVDNVVAIVGDCDLIAVVDIGGGGSHTEDRLATLARWEGSNRTQGVLVAEGGDLHGNREAGSQAVAKLGLVD